MYSWIEEMLGISIKGTTIFHIKYKLKDIMRAKNKTQTTNKLERTKNSGYHTYL